MPKKIKTETEENGILEAPEEADGEFENSEEYDPEETYPEEQEDRPSIEGYTKTIEDKGAELARETLTGDIRDFMLDRIRNQPMTWKEMTETEQRSIAASADEAARKLVRDAIAIMAKHERKTLTGKLDKVTIKDGAQAVFKVSNDDPYFMDLIDACGKACLIVVGSADSFDGERAPAKIDPQEPKLPLEDDDKPVFDNSTCGGESEPVDPADEKLRQDAAA